MRPVTRARRRLLSVVGSLLIVGGLLPIAAVAAATPVFINEVHYDNAGVDADEGIEVAGPAGTDLTGWTIVLYNGSGGASYDTDALTGTIPNQQSGFGTVNLAYPANGIQNGSPDGIALVNGSTVVQFLSYEGAFAATTGPAVGMTSTDIGVAEAGTETLGMSLQLQGSGGAYEDFVWTVTPIAQTRSAVNTGQTFGAADAAPSVLSSSPADGAANVALNTLPSITFSEPVAISSGGVTLTCTNQGPKAGTQSTTDNVTYTLTVSPFQAGDHCTLTVLAANVSDTDTNDPPDNMTANYVASFDTVAAATPPIVISEVYGGGGNAGATLRNDFIELYNPTGSAVNLSGWSVQYGSATGTTWQVTTLTGSIPAGANYLIQEAVGTGGTVNLPTPDATGTILMSATAGKVALVSNSTPLTGACPTGGAIVDLVGYGATANCFEGAGAAPAPSNILSIQRAGGGATDTNNNNADFATGAPDPHASGDPAPTVASTIPAGGATGVARAANITITFSEPVNVAPAWFLISCATSGPHDATVTGGGTTFDLNPDADFAANESCTVTVDAADVTDQDAADPPDNMAVDYVFSFTTIDAAVCGDPVTAIHVIQGSGTASPLAGSSASVEGIVVGDYQQTGSFGGFYVQEEDADADADAATSEGIFVFSSTAVGVGDQVRVSGTVIEFSNLTELSPATSVLVCSAGNSLPGAPTVTLPVSAVPDWERYEGMRIRIVQTLTVTETFTLGRFGEVDLSINGRLRTPTNVVAPGAPAIALQDLNNRSRILLDDGDNRQNIDPTLYPQGGLSFLNTLRIGDTLPSLAGVLDQRFGDYRVQPVGAIAFAHDNPRPTAPAGVGGTTRVAAFNVLNYFNGNGTGADGAAGGFPTPRGANNLAEFNRQRAKEITAITALNADVIGLMELENDDPNTENAAIEDLVAGLNGATAPGTYAFVNTGIVGTDQIRVGIVYKPAAVTPIGPYMKIDTTVDPRFIDTKNRPSIAQTFDVVSTGARFTVLVNHLKSKGSDCLDVGDPDTGDGQGNCNVTRTNAAWAIVDWLATDPTNSDDADFILLGDMNAYAREDPITVFKAGGFIDTIGAFIGADAYSYVFEGQSGYLDHALASGSLASQVTGVTEWHINADEPVVLDYNTEFKTANQVTTFYDPAAYRSSDHDPVLVGLALDAPVPGTVVVTKTGAGGAPLAAAGFTLFRDAVPTGGSRGPEDTAAAGSCTTNGGGGCSIRNVPLGSYWLVETTVPAGYRAVSPTAIVVGHGPSAGQGDTDTVILADVPVPGTVVVNKTGQGRAQIVGVPFILYIDAGPVGGRRGPQDTTIAGTCATALVGTRATCTITNVPLGAYWLVETVPPGNAPFDPVAIVVGLGASPNVGDRDTVAVLNKPKGSPKPKH